MKKYFLISFVFASMCVVPVSASNNDSQSRNISTLIKLSEALVAGDEGAIVKIDRVIDYSIPALPSASISPQQMIQMFNGCTAKPLSEVRHINNSTFLEYTCHDRTPVGQCSTGDLEIMVWSGSVGVLESRKFGDPSCRIPIPPAAPAHGES